MASSDRPRPLHVSRSFTRMADNTPPSPRKRASTLQESGIPAIPEARQFSGTSRADGKPMSDVFENNEDDEEEHGDKDETSSTMASDKQRKSSAASRIEPESTDSLDDLPIEIRSLSERFLDSLSAKVHPTPLSADDLSQMFQDFYERAASHINTHIANLAAQIGRKKSSTSLKGSGKGRARAGSGAKKGSSEDLAGSAGGEMLTAAEVADRKKARRTLELKRVALEEAVERGVCSKIYEKIYKHRSTDDEARDEKLRSRTAALAVVGIGLKELHIDLAKDDSSRTAEEKEAEMSEALGAARASLQLMDEEKSPRGKLLCLTRAHQSIVETLSLTFPSSSSADEILPTLIYSLITSPAENLNVVSNLSFIQRFRCASKIDGEAAYCMVNLEAAISFLETVDLSSLRADELPQGPPKSNSRPPTPSSDISPALSRPQVARTLSPSVSTTTVTSLEQSNSNVAAVGATRSLPLANTTRPPNSRRLSTLMQQQADRIEAGRENFLNAADKIYDSINGTLDNSLQFIFGRIKEQQQQITSGTSAGNTNPSPLSFLPKTLEDARKLVRSPSSTSTTSMNVADGPLLDGDDEDAASSVGAKSTSGRSSPGTTVDGDALSSTSAANNGSSAKLLDLVGGRRQPLRERSVDSARSGGSGKRVAFATAAASITPLDGPPGTNLAGGTPSPLFGRSPSASVSHAGAASQDPSLANLPANLFASINPLNRFGMPAFPRFGRASTPTTPTTTLPPQQQNVSSTASARELAPTSTMANPAQVQNNAVFTETNDPATTLVASPMSHIDPSPLPNDSLIQQYQQSHEALAALRKIKPPRKKFLEAASAAELRIGDVGDLLLEYRRLAKAIGEALTGVTSQSGDAV